MPDDSQMLLGRARNFRLVWIGQVVSVVGDGMQKVALLWWARTQGGNALLAAVALAAMLPVILGSPLGGWLADRHDRRRLMIGADGLRMAVTAGLAALVLSGHDSPPVIVAGVALVAFGTAVFDPTYAAVVPSLVDESDLRAANGLNMANGAVGGLIGPLVGGALVAVFSIGTVLVLNAATFAWSAACIARATIRRPVAAPAEGSSAAEHGEADTRGAFRVVLRDRQLRRLLGLAMTLNMAVAPMSVLLVALVADRFHRGSLAFGTLDVMISLGVLVGSLVVGRVPNVTLAAAVLVLAVCLGLAGTLPIAGTAVAFAIGGVAIALANTALLSLFQTSVPEHMHGRLFGAVGAAGLALRPLGLALGAPLLAVAGVSGAFLAVAVGLAIPALLWAGPVFARPLGVPDRPADDAPPAEQTADGRGLDATVA